MVETYTTRLRAVQQEYNSNTDVWGTELNLGALEILDAAWAVTEVTVSGNVTLTVSNKIADQSRGFVLILSGAGGFTVTTPANNKPYLIVNNCAADVQVKPSGGTPATVRAGTAAIYYTNAAATAGNVVDPTLDKIKAPTADVAFGGFKLTGAAAGMASTDVATLSNKVHQFAAPTSALDMNSQKITGIGAATLATDAASLANRLNQFTAPNANVSFGGFKITNLADPTSAQDAVTKTYLDTLAASTSLGTVAAIAPQIVTVAGISTQVTTVAGISANVTTVAGISGNVTTVAGISANVTSVAGNAANITTVANNITSVNTVAANVTSVTNFGSVYYPASSTDPTTRPDGSSRQAGDLYFNTVGNSLRVWSGSNWIPITSVTLATQAQAEAGTDNTTVMTPLRTSQAIAALANFRTIRPHSTRTSNFAALAFYRYRCETGAGSVTATLPASPTDGDIITIRRKGANSVTAARNGKTINGTTTDLVLDVDKSEVDLTFNGTTQDWEVSARIYQ